MIHTAVAKRAIETHGTIFFDADLNPVVPQLGQWFCEYDDEFDLGDSNALRDEAFVEYIGNDDSVIWSDEAKDFVAYGDPMFRHLVAPESDDGETRRPTCVILIRQS